MTDSHTFTSGKTMHLATVTENGQRVHQSVHGSDAAAWAALYEWAAERWAKNHPVMPFPNSSPRTAIELLLDTDKTLSMEVIETVARYTITPTK